MVSRGGDDEKKEDRHLSMCMRIYTNVMLRRLRSDDMCDEERKERRLNACGRTRKRTGNVEEARAKLRSVEML